MVASMQGDASITRTELGVGKVPGNYSYCSSRACKYPSGHSRNTRYSESQQIALTNTNASMALSSCSLFTGAELLLSNTELPAPIDCRGSRDAIRQCFKPVEHLPLTPMASTTFDNEYTVAHYELFMSSWLGIHKP